VVGGSNGTCAVAYLCQGVVGYDGPTGLGTPSGTTPFTMPGVPGQPTSVTAVPSNGSATVSWVAPTSDGGAPITKYTVTASPGGGTCTWTSGPYTCTVAGLANGVGYTFTVTATNASGTSAPSSPSPTVTVRGVPGQPQNVAGLPGDSSVTVSWSAPVSDGGSSLTGYTVNATPGGGTCAAPPTMTSCTVIGLVNGQGYTFAVTAANAVGTGHPSAPSAAVTPRTVPGAPTNVQAQPGNASAQVAWSPPSFDGGAAITGYTVTAWPSGSTCAWSSGALACTVTGLTNGQTYMFTVVATNAAGDGYVSGSSAFVTLPTLPAPPVGVTATLPATPAAGSLDVTWTATRSASSPVTGYTATAYLAGTSTSTGRSCTVTGTPPGTSCTIRGLTPGVAVIVRVAATSVVGTGDASGPSGSVTPPVPPSASVASLPTWTVAASLEVPLAGSPGTNAIATYEVRFRRAMWNGSFGAYAYRSTTTPSFSLAVSAGATYCFSARARDDQGYASPAWSAERCTAVPLDDRSLSAHGTWGRSTGSAYYRATSTRSYAYGAALVRTSVKAKRVAIVATTCPTCGSIRVYLGSTLLRSISLRSSTTVNGRVITVADFGSVRSGTLTIKVSTSGRMVRIDGLAVSRK
jgi:Fibronectin type III domain